MNSMMPPDFDATVRSAIRSFWRALTDSSPQTSMDGFATLARAIARHVGLDDAVRVGTSLPGLFSPTTHWDLTIIHHGRLLAALKFSAQVAGDVRDPAPEALALAHDLRAAWLSSVDHPDRARTMLGGETRRWPHPPFMGYLLLVEDCAEANQPTAPAGPTFDEFAGRSQVERCRILCDRLVRHGVWNSAAVLVTEAEAGRETGAWRSFPGLGPQAFFWDLMGALGR